MEMFDVLATRSLFRYVGAGGHHEEVVTYSYYELIMPNMYLLRVCNVKKKHDFQCMDSYRSA